MSTAVAERPSTRSEVAVTPANVEGRSSFQDGNPYYPVVDPGPPVITEPLGVLYPALDPLNPAEGPGVPPLLNADGTAPTPPAP